MQAGHRLLPAQFHYIEFAHHGIALRHLRKPEEPIGNGEDRIVFDLLRGVFADEKSGGFPTGQKLGETLDKTLQLLSARSRQNFARHRAKGIHHHEARPHRGDLLGDLLENGVEILLHDDLGQIDKADGGAQLRFVEKRILLLIAQHLHRGLAEDGEEERGFLRRRVGEKDLVGEGRLSATGRARDDIEGKFRDAAAEDVVQAAHAGRQFADDDFARPTGHFRRLLAFRGGVGFFHE